jgi:HRDC domain-containing protein
MARTYPANSTEFRRIPGVGEQKLKDFGEAFLGEIKRHSAANPRRTFSEDSDVRDLKRRSQLSKNDRQ